VKPDEEKIIEEIKNLMGAGVIHAQQARIVLGLAGQQGRWFSTEEPLKVEDMRGSRQVCPECRIVAPIVLTCSHANKIWVTPKWRAPKKGNDRAWKRIAAGDLLWDHSAVEAVAKMQAQRQESAAELLRKNRRNRQTLSIHVRKG
jgi:hypothetical protein